MESKKQTKPELLFKKFLDCNSIEYISQKAVGLGFVDFHLIKENLSVEIDGEYYHVDIKENMTFTQMTNATADLRKDKYVDVRIRANDVKYINCLDDLFEYHVTYQKIIPFDQILLSSSYLTKFHTSDTVEYLLGRVPTVEKFIKTYFETEFTQDMKENLLHCFIHRQDVTFNKMRGTV